MLCGWLLNRYYVVVEGILLFFERVCMCVYVCCVFMAMYILFLMIFAFILWNIIVDEQNWSYIFYYILKKKGYPFIFTFSSSSSLS